VRLRILLLLALVGGGVHAETLRLEVTADTSIAAHESETTLNLGGSSHIRIKGIQHFMLMKFDLASVARQTVSQAVLHLRSASQKLWLRTVGLSSISADWEEGVGTGQPVPGAVCFAFAAFPDKLWAGPQSDFTDVTFGIGNTLAAYTDIREVDDGWLEVDVPPELVQAMICGDSYGLVLSDEKGQTMANNDVYSREQSASRPYLTVECDRLDRQPPAPPEGLKVEAAPALAHLDSGALRITFRAPKDDNPTGRAFTYEGELVPAGGATRPIPRWAIPHAAQPGEAQEIVLTDLPPGAPVGVRLRAVGGAGNRSEGVAAAGAVSPALSVPVLSGRAGEETADKPSVPGIGVWAAPAEVKVSPISGGVLEDGKESYHGVWIGKQLRTGSRYCQDRVDLSAGRKQFASFQLIIEPRTRPAEATVRIAPFGCAQGKTLSASDVELFREWYVKDDDLWYPEVAIPLTGPVSIPSPDNPVTGVVEQQNQAIWVDLFVPADAAVGEHASEAEVAIGQETYRLPITLRVSAPTMPDELSFNLDLNGYGTVGGPFGVSDASPEYRALEREYHRLAHRHRATLDLLGYSHSGRLSTNYAPPVAGHGDQLKITDWSSWDEQFGPYLSGEAFRDLPRGPVPIHNMYLWLHENWPEPMAEHYTAPPVSADFPLMIAEHAMLAKPIELALDADFAAGFRAAARQIAEHFAERGWTRTQFQCYLNNKNNYKDPKQGGRGTSWWLLDEPNYRDDWLALEYFGRLFAEGENRDGAHFRQEPRFGLLSRMGSVPVFAFREDISRPQWQRTWLRDSLDLMVLSSTLFEKNRRCLAIQRETGCTLWNYGEGNRISDSNLTAVLWPLRAYLAGAEAIVPWNTIGDDGDYNEPDPTAILYPGKRFGANGPIASLRLKAWRDGAQTVALLSLLAEQRGWNREQTAKAVVGMLGLKLTDEEIALEPWRVVEGMRVQDVGRLTAEVLREGER